MLMRRWLTATLWVSLCAFFLTAFATVLWLGAVAIVLAPLAFVASLLGFGSGGNIGQKLLGPFLIYAAAFIVTALASAYCVRITVKRFRPVSRLPAAEEIAHRQATGLATNVWIREPYLPIFGVLSSLMAGGAIGVLACSLIVNTWWQKANPPSADDIARQSPLPHTDRDAAELRDRWRPAAERGDAYAQFVVGEAHANGLMGLSPSAPQARDWLKKSAAKGDADAMLSLIIAERTGSLGDRQQFDNDPAFIAYAQQQPGWRAAAVHLMLADTARKTSEGSTSPDQIHRDWLRKAAQGGSRHAAFRLGRAFELKRSPEGRNAPDIAQAIAWYQVAGANLEIERLVQTTEFNAGPPAIVVDAKGPSADECDRLKRRAAMVDQRLQTLHAVDVRTHDAMAHRTIQADACENFREVADYFAEPFMGGRYGRDDKAAFMYYELAARRGDVGSMLRLAEHAFTEGLGEVWAVIYSYKWYALAVEALAGKDDAASNALRSTAEAGYNKARATLLGPARDEAEAALAELKTQLKR
jgi:TPR repeat protein/NADH:ubiquinone oxidoreductase subunit 6 (subunit J)